MFLFNNSSEVAKGLKQESYGLVFGINTFLALLFQTILTLIVADSAGLALDPPDQVIIYARILYKFQYNQKIWFCLVQSVWRLLFGLRHRVSFHGCIQRWPSK